MIKIKPILFSTPMVQAILDGSKTHTRRIQGLEKFNQNPNRYRYDGVANLEHQPQYYTHYFETLDKHRNPTEKYTPIEAKVKPGDILWVRETFEFVPVNKAPLDQECYVQLMPKYKADGSECFNKWKPSIFMPKVAARIFLEVINVRLERLLDISEADALAEGVIEIEKGEAYKCYTDDAGSFTTARGSFTSLWESINGLDSWKENPFVWVYEFKQTEKPKNF